MLFICSISLFTGFIIMPVLTRPRTVGHPFLLLSHIAHPSQVFHSVGKQLTFLGTSQNLLSQEGAFVGRYCSIRVLFDKIISV